MRYSFKKQLAVLLAVVTVTPYSAFAEAPVSASDTEKPVIRDVELHVNGVAHGRVLDAHGRPAPATTVELHTKAGVRQALTDQRGDFAVAGLTGGPCLVKVGKNSFGCRLWTNKTAPPKSLKMFTVVSQDGPVVRGQNDDNRLSSITGLSAGKVLGLALFAGAVTAVVIATQDDDKSPSASD